MKVSLSQAAKLAGISRQHLYAKYLNTGILSVERDNPDKPVIDTAELLRVFKDIKLPDSAMSGDGHELIGEMSSKIAALDSELQVVRQQLSASQDREKWLQSTVDKLTDTIRMIEHRPAEPAPTPRRGFWSRLFGKG